MRGSGCSLRPASAQSCRSRRKNRQKKAAILSSACRKNCSAAWTRGGSHYTNAPWKKVPGSLQRIRRFLNQARHRLRLRDIYRVAGLDLYRLGIGALVQWVAEAEQRGFSEIVTESLARLKTIASIKF